MESSDSIPKKNILISLFTSVLNSVNPRWYFSDCSFENVIENRSRSAAYGVPGQVTAVIGARNNHRFNVFLLSFRLIVELRNYHRVS